MNEEAALRDRALAVIPSGMYGHQSIRYLTPDYPQFFSKALGTRLWSADGQELIDFMAAFGTNLFGYGEPSIEAAAWAQSTAGDTMTGPSPVIVDLAEKLVSMVSHAAWAIFCKNGVDANSMAMVCARAYTKRKKILIATGAYHGAAPWCVPSDAGITPEDKANNVYFEYNSVESLEAALKANKGNVAGVYATPFRHDVFADQTLPSAEFAQAARRLCDEHDALLIVDEIRTGLRLARGSSWDVLGVQPDLSSWGKAIANGYAISALLGSEKIRAAASEIFVTGSYWFSAVPMAAALRTLELAQSTDYLEKTIRLGELFRAGIAEQASRLGIGVRQTGPCQMPQILFEDDPGAKRGYAWANEAVKRGVYLHPFHNMFINAAMTDEDIHQALDVTEEAFKASLNTRVLA
ncbi:aminotransferase class III-fold pyridoxal phosphate-dependent enzyme [Trinickia mobilis]|uniref:aminotransferase class III-fold pyridoxal phosphate-dependent enzyme n=1 Tax=Trinickia mobilis TaxID=2816356 RepID=UPI001A8E7C94|nr:aminotransferase class III-fold pyridoxal phosphate-dependent enzyme [Trinickia mobilis]